MGTSMRIPDVSYQQVAELRDHGGFESLTSAIAVAVDRLYQAIMPASDVGRLRAGMPARCAGCDAQIDPADTWHPGMYGEILCQECQAGDPRSADVRAITVECGDEDVPTWLAERLRAEYPDAAINVIRRPAWRRET